MPPIQSEHHMRPNTRLNPDPHLRVLKGVLIAALAMTIAPASAQIDKARTAEKAAVASSTHPYAGFWKGPGCADRFGLAISPAEGSLYSVSFCGPGGCFLPGTYRPDTRLGGDPDYRLVDKDTIEVRTIAGFSRYVRCPGR